MARRARYVRDDAGFTAFALSGQMRRPVKELSKTIAAEAAATDGTSIADQYGVDSGPTVVVDGRPRVSERVWNYSNKAAAYEFGSGEQGEGASGSDPRPQGGSSPARRHLGYIAAGYHDVLGAPG